MYYNVDAKILTNINYLGNELKEIFSNFKIHKTQKISLINSLMKELSEKLEQLELFEKEFYDFLSIQNMIQYIIKDTNRFLKFSSFARHLAENFHDLINQKTELLRLNKYENYEDVYSKFSEYLYNQEHYFYLKIFVPNRQYDDLIDKVTNILWDSKSLDECINICELN